MYEYYNLISGYENMTRNQKKAARKKYKKNKEQPMQLVFHDVWCEECGELHALPTGVATTTESKKENKMDTLELQKNYAFDRLYQIYHDKDKELQKKFGLVDDDAPNNPEDMIDRITKGRYVLREAAIDQYDWGPFSRISWRDPEMKADQDGYKAASPTLDKAYQSLKDRVKLTNDPTDMLKAVQEFETT